MKFKDIITEALSRKQALHKPYELCRFLSREVLDVKKERYRDPVFSAFKVRIALK